MRYPQPITHNSQPTTLEIDMHAQHLEITPDMDFFADAGISPNGVCWVVPTDDFFRVWEGPTGAYLKKQGFRLRNDGKALGASQDRILVVPSLKLL